MRPSAPGSAPARRGFGLLSRPAVPPSQRLARAARQARWGALQRGHSGCGGQRDPYSGRGGGAAACCQQEAQASGRGTPTGVPLVIRTTAYLPTVPCVRHTLRSCVLPACVQGGEDGDAPKGSPTATPGIPERAGGTAEEPLHLSSDDEDDKEKPPRLRVQGTPPRLRARPDPSPLLPRARCSRLFAPHAAPLLPAQQAFLLWQAPRLQARTRPADPAGAHPSSTSWRRSLLRSASRPTPL